MSNTFVMNGDIVTLAGAALVAVMAVAELLFHPVRGRTGTDKLLGWLGKLAFVGGAVGWLMMWLAEGAIWSPTPRHCTALASIQLKGQTYRNCSHLVHRYQAGEWLFYGSVAVLAFSFALGKRRQS